MIKGKRPGCCLEQSLTTQPTQVGESKTKSKSLVILRGPKSLMKKRYGQKRKYRHISFEQKLLLLLEVLTELGLPDNCAGSLLGRSSNSLLFSSIRANRESFNSKVQAMKLSELTATQAIVEKKDSMALFYACFTVSNALDAQMIHRQNINAIDSKTMSHL